MPQGNPKPGELYLHFKKKLYQIITIAEHSETHEPLVIYQALYGTFQAYARPLAMFISPVDTEKYPDAGQAYRFQLVMPEQISNENKESDAKNGTAQLPDNFQLCDNTVNVGNTENIGITENNENTEKGQQEASAEEKLMAFFDADTMDEKYKILLEMRNDVDDRMINNMAVVLDVVIDEGPLDQRYEELKTCIRTFRRYETTRLR